MIEVIETNHKLDGTTEENKKRFSTKGAFIRLLKQNELLPSECIDDLSKHNECAFLFDNLKREIKIVRELETAQYVSTGPIII